MSEDGEVLLEYEQNEVLWAKIRGFPWWPAYVSEVHANSEPEQVQYTVIFFGDNTHSRLGPYKLRKFLQSYASFYAKAKTNRKLKISIMKAEERLKENQQNVEIYEQVRTSLKNKRKTGTKTDSRVSQSENQDDNQPQSKKSKTISHKGRKPKKQKSLSPKQQKSEQEEDNSSEVKPQPPKKQLRKANRIRNIFGVTNENQQSKEEPKKQLKLRTRRASHQVVKSTNKEEQEQSHSVSEKSKSEKPEEQKKPKGKKGRPRKIEVKAKKQSQEEQSEPQPVPKLKPLTKRRSVPVKPTLQKYEQEHNIESNLSAHQLQNIEKIKKCLNDKQELINTLSKISITSNNVKQILDLGISNILLEGQMTREAYIILESMKATLLHKYFPDDLKMKKKHERMIKKKKNMFKAKVEEEKSEQNEDEDNEDKREGEQIEKIRKKTVLKLQKILRKSGLEDNAKDLSIRVEGSFQERSELSGEKYTNIAYGYMRKLKMKMQEKEPSERIVDYLNQITESLENSADR